MTQRLVRALLAAKLAITLHRVSFEAVGSGKVAGGVSVRLHAVISSLV